MEAEIERATVFLQEGKVILYPTDTIWGLGCDATNEEAVERIYRIKNRSDSKSMLVLVADLVMLKSLLNEVPDAATDIIKNAGKPTTIIYPGARNLARNLIAGDGSVGIRLTSDPFCRALIMKSGRALVSTSANASGEPSPANYSEISDSIVSQTDYVVNWRRNEKRRAQPSSILKIKSGGGLIKLR